jgi:hypothetical protein
MLVFSGFLCLFDNKNVDSAGAMRHITVAIANPDDESDNL